jgi:hypothetical protein
MNLLIICRSSIRRKRMSFFAFASICDISHDRFYRHDARNSRVKNEHCDASMHRCALLRTFRRRSCERFYERFRSSFRRLHLHFLRLSF